MDQCYIHGGEKPVKAVQMTKGTKENFEIRKVF